MISYVKNNSLEIGDCDANFCSTK